MEEVAEAVGGGYCRLQMPLKLALCVRGTVAGRRQGAPGGGGGYPRPLSNAFLGGTPLRPPHCTDSTPKAFPYPNTSPPSHSQPPVTAPPNRFHTPRDRSATAPGLPRWHPPLQAKPCSGPPSVVLVGAVVGGRALPTSPFGKNPSREACHRRDGRDAQAKGPRDGCHTRTVGGQAMQNSAHIQRAGGAGVYMYKPPFNTVVFLSCRPLRGESLLDFGGQSDAQSTAVGHFAPAKRPPNMGTGTLSTGKKAPIYGHGDGSWLLTVVEGLKHRFPRCARVYTPTGHTSTLVHVWGTTWTPRR